MPCTYGDEVYKYPSELEVANKELDKLTNMLCFIMTKLDKLNTEEYFKIVYPDTVYLTQWWEEHKLKDKKRN